MLERKRMTKSILDFIVFLLMGSITFSQQNIWEPVGDPGEGNVFTVLAIDTEDNLYAGTYFNFIRSTNNGDEWISIYNGYYVTSIVFNSQDEMFIGTGSGGGIFKSLDKGETWMHLDDSLISFSISDLDITSNGYLFAAIRGRGMYRSTDNGENWGEIINGLTYYRSLNELYISKTGPMQDYLFVSVGEPADFNYIFRSSDYGESWEQLNFSDRWYRVYTFASNSDGIIYIGLGDTAPHSNNGVIYKSTNFGYDWISLVSTSNITELILDNNEFIYAGTAEGWTGGCQGIIRTTNGGNNWEQFDSGLSQGSCGFVLGCNSEGILFTATVTGFYRTVESTTDIGSNKAVIPEKFKLFQNYPNPFNPSTIIEYQILEISFVTLKVFDVMGNEISTIVNEEQPAGSYEVGFDGSDISSGVYIYQLLTSRVSMAEKMVLLK